jgi:ssDNA-binding Zn-finger/Zn-ribbon topoisomerase 1
MARGRSRTAFGFACVLCGLVITSIVMTSRYAGVWNDHRPLWDRVFLVVKSGAVSVVWIESKSPFGLTAAPPENLFVWRAVSPPDVLWVLPPEPIVPWGNGKVFIDTNLIHFSTRTDAVGLVMIKRVDFVLWPFAAASLLLGVFLIFRGRRARRFADKSRCPHCEYALVGLAPGTACPECGRPQTPSQDPAPTPPLPQ